MIWSGKLYVGDGVVQTQSALRADIDAGNVLKYKKEYVVVLALNPQNLLELLPVKELALPYYREAGLHIVGLAADKSEAQELVRRMIEEVVRVQGNTDVKAYFRKTS